MAIFEVTINQTIDSEELLKEIKDLKTLLMASIAELTAKVDQLQVALDNEQQQIADAIAALNVTITDLTAMVAAGGTEAERQALLDKLTAIQVDLEGTVTP